MRPAMGEARLGPHPLPTVLRAAQPLAMQTASQPILESAHRTSIADANELIMAMLP
jgi:hypothetical protein